jgi:hypothetical protein
MLLSARTFLNRRLTVLKYEGQWQALTAEERLFLLAMAHELPQVSGLGVRYDDVMSNAGFDFDKLCEVAYSLERKNLIKVDGGDPIFFAFRGDAVTRSLCLAKFSEYEEKEVVVRKYSYPYRMREPRTAPA